MNALLDGLSLSVPARRSPVRLFAPKVGKIALLVASLAFAPALTAQALDAGKSTKGGGGGDVGQGGGNSASNGSRGGNGGGQGGTRTGSVDDEWAALKTLSKSAGAPSRTQKRTREEAGAEHAKQVSAARATEQAAKDFYTRNPSDPRAAEARKTEAIAALRGVTAGDSAQELSAVAIARAYRSDKSAPVKDRFDVAVAMETQNLAIKARSGLVPDRAAEQAKIVQDLRAEFSLAPEVEAYAVSVARRSDPRTASALAAQVARSPVASTRDQREATAIKDRAKLLGRPVDLAVPLAEGGQLVLGGKSEHVTIVVVWSPNQPRALESLEVFSRPLPRGARLVTLALGGSKADAARPNRDLPVVTHSAYAPPGATAKQVGEALKVHLAPYVYVLNRSGVLTDFGTLDDLPDVLTRAGIAKRKNS